MTRAKKTGENSTHTGSAVFFSIFVILVMEPADFPPEIRLLIFVMVRDESALDELMALRLVSQR